LEASVEGPNKGFFRGVDREKFEATPATAGNE
jgi:hypothetical protein